MTLSKGEDTYLLTSWSRVLFEKLTVNFAASQEFPRIYGTRKFLTVPTSAHKCGTNSATPPAITQKRNVLFKTLLTPLNSSLIFSGE
jgi:hypothetical protein